MDGWCKTGYTFHFNIRWCSYRAIFTWLKIDVLNFIRNFSFLLAKVLSTMQWITMRYTFEGKWKRVQKYCFYFFDQVIHYWRKGYASHPDAMVIIYYISGDFVVELFELDFGNVYVAHDHFNFTESSVHFNLFLETA